MKHARIVAMVMAIAVTIGVTAAAGSAGTSGGGGEEPQASEVGLTADEFHVAVVADVETSVAPGLFQGSVDGVEGWAKWVNKNGGLAGRKVVVDFYDSKLSADDARNAVIKACSDDFAMVGTSALFLNNVDDQLACVDKAGAATGLPDIPFVTTEIVQQCSPITFPVAPPQILCDTKDDTPQTYQANVARGYYYDKEFGDDLHGVYVIGADLKAARNSQFASLAQVREVCCKSDQDFDMSSRAPQSEYTPVVQTMKDDGSNYGTVTSTFNMMVSLRKEAKLQGLTGVKVWDCGTGCYDTQFLEQGGADVEDQFVDTLYLPFLDAKERKANKMLDNFYKNTGADNAGKIGAVYSWVAGLALKQAVDAVVEKSGVNGVTRAAVLEELNNIHEFDGDGMFAPIDLGGRKVSECHVLLQVQDGDFERIQPTKPGTFQCAKKNRIETELDLL